LGAGRYPFQEYTDEQAFRFASLMGYFLVAGSGAQDAASGAGYVRLHINCTSWGIRWYAARTAKEWRVNIARTAPEQGMEQNSLLLPAMRPGNAE
jgi:hypothetical protein